MAAQISYGAPRTYSLTIATGAIAIPATGEQFAVATIDTESAGATDDLTAITLGVAWG